MCITVPKLRRLPQATRDHIVECSSLKRSRRYGVVPGSDVAFKSERSPGAGRRSAPNGVELTQVRKSPGYSRGGIHR